MFLVMAVSEMCRCVLLMCVSEADANLLSWFVVLVPSKQPITPRQITADTVVWIANQQERTKTGALLSEGLGLIELAVEPLDWAGEVGLVHGVAHHNRLVLNQLG